MVYKSKVVAVRSQEVEMNVLGTAIGFLRVVNGFNPTGSGIISFPLSGKLFSQGPVRIQSYVASFEPLVVEG